MQTKIKFPSLRLMLSLFMCSSAVILLQNINLSKNRSFTFDLLCILSASFISLLFFVPNIILKKNNNTDFMSFAHSKTPSGVIFTAAYYSIYFVFVAEYFLVSYTDMFVKKLNPEANIFVVSILLIATCIYASYKGASAITRCGIFIFSFSLIGFILIFAGNISNLDFQNYPFEISGNYSDFISGVSFYLTPSFVAVIFATISGYTKKFKTRQTAITLGFITIVFVTVMFFIRFALGDYAYSQEYPSYVLSKSSHMGVISGMDGFYLSISTLSVFLVISLLLTCLTKTSGKSSSMKIILIFSVIIYVLFICAQNLNSVREILLNTTVLNALTFISAVVIPTIYMLIFRRRIDV